MIVIEIQKCIKESPGGTKEFDFCLRIQNSLKSDSHISSVVNKDNQHIGLMKRSFCFMDKSLLLTLYKSIVRSHSLIMETQYGSQLLRRINS